MKICWLVVWLMGLIFLVNSSVTFYIYFSYELSQTHHPWYTHTLEESDQVLGYNTQMVVGGIVRYCPKQWSIWSFFAQGSNQHNVEWCLSIECNLYKMKKKGVQVLLKVSNYRWKELINRRYLLPYRALYKMKENEICDVTIITSPIHVLSFLAL